ncbi:SDR family oxidoreductase [Paenibacillus whitsoniae]|uniref:SDR family NAD(P)-dependent oxidoreductase n=1 Tax=Paenibacillus whitsoniae TaxID=2496558 RepID=A0A3S0A6S0_9BACL|nr:SDR family NAD(P)-dependent oxidoreductase [Paenibacillus whitsoniae]RTE10928.1 SDR family NAD(P)-dependent oxidoreductase [Paenibacillus whitsoniae]
MKMSGNTVLITGGSSGIGFEFASQLLQLGNTVIITGRDQARLDAAKKKLPTVHTFQSDAGDPQAIADLYAAVVSQFPKLNVLINNAGFMRRINLHMAGNDQDDLNSEIVTNLSGPIWMVQQFLSHLKRQESAAIINVSSGLAFVPLPISPIYCAAKAGLHSYTLSLRAQLKNTSVKVFELAPPLTETPLVDAFDSAEMAGSKAMPVADMVSFAITRMKRDHYEIRPGQSNALKMLSRLAPNFIFSQLSKSVDHMLGQTNK